MRTRQNILENFSTFLQFDADRVNGWATDARLRRSMEQCLTQSSQMGASEHFWALYWHKVWQTQSDAVNALAIAHLSAYLQEVCYWTSRKMLVRFASGQSIADLFQMAIARIDKVIKGFNPNHSLYLKRYASLAFSNVIKDTLRQRQEVDVCSNWALLHKLSQKRFVESLENLGLNSSTIASYVLAWRCFKIIYAPSESRTSQKLGKPDPAAWQAIAHLYNTERITELGATAPEAHPELLEKWLTTCSNAARSYLYPTFVSTDAPISGQESTELIDLLPDTLQESLLSEVMIQEEEADRQSQQNQLNTVLFKALLKLDLPAQRLLQLYYGQGLTQQQIAQTLDMKQYTVSRRLTQLRQSLLLALAQWSQESLHLSIDSNVLNNMSNLLEEWLKVHYGHPDLLSPADQSQ